ncbi:peptidylprolyl isomerase [Flavobacterium cyanobacteriorum]|uniref:Peptidylprolyl isomerase n=1 Tax=Flavobacterium cyanobacteriorum TaxID=2022802 RepID=A0A255Z888_9FLAO|nr:peptidylprolyl isomerase [Flavobacterium cyanobacteriorum]OYQ37666.1 peptidylprolyl isomerase [Flavobacterium cyanobacteriorum]
MKSINSRITLFFTFVFFAAGTAAAQEIIKETKQDTVKPVSAKGRVKVDGVVAVVGDYVVLDSDIDLMYKELQAQNIPTKDVTRCDLLGKLMEDKLYAHQAIQDSIVVTDADVNETMNRQIDYFVENLGSVDKVVKYFKKKSLEAFRAELFEMIKNQKLTEQMQKKIIDDVQITPEEVRQFYAQFKKDELPVFGAEMEVAQIVIKPEVSQAEKQAVIDRLREIKREVQEGASFYSKAVLYSEDPGSRSSGGYIKMNRKAPLVKEFKDVAFSTEEGQISEPFETEYGYHIIYVEKVRGQELDVRHILMTPKVSNEALKKAKEKIEKIRSRIAAGEITFADAARSESDEKETKNSGGLLINPRTFGTRFELTKMDPSLYNDISDLKDNEVSRPILVDESRTGKHYKIMMVTNRYDEHVADYAKDYLKIKELALKEKQKKTLSKWNEEKIKDTYIKVNGDYRACTFANHWVK